MKERIKMIMDAEDMSPARFADRLQIGRAVISHILNGRNNPSLDIITRILIQMPTIDTDWLLTGVGNMYRTDNTEKRVQAPTLPENIGQADLFSQITMTSSDRAEYKTIESPSFINDIPVEKPITEEKIVHEKIVYKEKIDKKVTQIIIYYSDNTFEVFSSGQKIS